MTSAGDNISVAVRVRPAKRAKDANEWVVHDEIIYAAKPNGQHSLFAFDHIFSQEKTNADVYAQVVQPIITSVMAGYHGTVFAYGQTSSGKTHTMMGNDQDPGIIRRAIVQIFDEIHEQSDREFLIRISFLEIYNEQVRDLLSNSSAASLQIKGPDMAVPGLTENVTTDAEQILRFMIEGDKKRRVGFTNMNERSSRSHSIFRITVESSKRNSQTNTKEGVRMSQLNLVDLAGCERATQSGASATRLREGCHINTSLTVLGLVIRKLSNGERHINFRDSKLTRILQNSLGGNSRTAIICNISPSNFETSLSTLRFGSAAKRIKNKPVINQVLSGDSSLLQKRNEEIESLKALILKVETGREQQLKEKDDAIEKLRKKIDSLQKLAIGGNVHSSTPGGDVLSTPTRCDHARRRATWCPGRTVASAIPMGTPPIDELNNVQENLLVPPNHKESSFLFPPVMPRKRKSEEAFSAVKTDVSSSCCSMAISNSESLKSSNALGEVPRQIASLNEELESVAKRARTGSSQCAATPAPIDMGGRWWREDESPFAAKLRIMATPIQEILSLRLENLMLKRRLGIASVRSTTAACEDLDAVLPPLDRSPPSASEPKSETCGAARQFEELDIQLERNPMPQTEFRNCRTIRRSASTSAMNSETTRGDVGKSQETLPRSVHDIGVQVALLGDVPHVSRDRIETLSEFSMGSEASELCKETLGSRMEETLIEPPLPSILSADAEVQTELRPDKSQPKRVDFGVQVSVESSCCATQAYVDMTDANTSTSSPRYEDFSTQTVEEEKVSTRDVGIMAHIEELWIIKMSLENERTAREEAESKLNEVRNESAKLNRTIDKFLEYFETHGIDTREVLSGQIAANPETGVTESDGGAGVRARPSSRTISLLRAEKKERRSM